MSISHVQLFSVLVSDQDQARAFRTSEIEAAPWGRFVTFDDPDGNGIVLQETTSQPR